MPQFDERIVSGESRYDSQSAQLVREFTTGYLTQESALADPRCPQIGSPHPNYPNLFADRHNFKPKSDGTLDLTVLYSNNGSGKIYFNQDKSDDYLRWGFGINSRVTDIPVFTLAEKIVTSGTSAATLKVWEPDTIRVAENNATLWATVVVPKLVLADMGQIIAQISKVHEIPIGSGIYYAFMPPAVRNIDTERDEITYTWEKDSGTRQPASIPFQSPKKMVVPPPLTVGGVVYWRAPYTTLVVIPPPPQTGTGTPPEPEISWMYTNYADHNGWVSLPGLDRI
jgi:hypothetical protein